MTSDGKLFLSPCAAFKSVLLHKVVKRKVIVQDVSENFYKKCQKAEILIFFPCIGDRAYIDFKIFDCVI